MTVISEEMHRYENNKKKIQEKNRIDFFVFENSCISVHMSLEELLKTSSFERL